MANNMFESVFHSLTVKLVILSIVVISIVINIACVVTFLLRSYLDISLYKY